MKLSINLLRIFVDPLFKLIGCLYVEANLTAKLDICKEYIKIFKNFLNFPIKTLNKIINSIIGYID
jgi:hypothetical protein